MKSSQQHLTSFIVISTYAGNRQHYWPMETVASAKAYITQLGLATHTILSEYNFSILEPHLKAWSCSPSTCNLEPKTINKAIKFLDKIRYFT